MLMRVFSAGGIVTRDFKGEKKVLVTQHSGHKGWDFPKGHVESGEKSEDTAIREVEEETGVKAKVLKKVGKSEYFYFEQGEKVFKTVTFFLMEYTGEGEATTAFEVSDKIWLPVNEVRDKLSFEGSKKIWGEAKEAIG